MPIHLSKKGQLVLLLVLLGIPFQAASRKIPAGEIAPDSKSDLISAQTFYQKALRFSEKAQYDSSTFFFKEAATIFLEKANTNNDTLTWIRYFDCQALSGDDFRKNGQYQQALDILNPALQKSQQILGNSHLTSAKIMNSTGRVYVNEGKYNDAEEIFKSTMALAEGQLPEIHDFRAQIYNNLGNVYLYKGQYDSALEYYQKDLTISLQLYGEQNAGVASSYYNMGIVYDIRGDYEKALSYYEKSLDIKIATLGANHPNVAKNYNGIAIVYAYLGDSQRSILYFEKALNSRRSSYGEKHPLVAESYNNLGVIYERIRDYQNAEKFYTRALGIRKQILEPDHPELGQSYNNMGLIYLHQQRYEHALQYLQRALEIRQKSNGPNHPLVASCYRNMGEVYLEKEDYSRARQNHEKALRIRQSTLGAESPHVAQSFNKIGRTYAGEKLYLESIKYYQKALVTLVPTFKDTNIFTNPPLEQIRSEEYLLGALAYKARAFLDLYQSDSSKKEFGTTSVSTYQLASQLLDQMQLGYASQESKYVWGELAHPIYEEAIQISLLIFYNTGETHYRDQAFGFAEKSHANVLLQSLYESRAKKFANIPAELLEEERQLRIDLTYYHGELQQLKSSSSKQDSLKKIQLDNTIFILNEDYQQLIGQFENTYPEYYRLKYEIAPPSLAEIQAKLTEIEGATAKFFWGDSNIYIFYLDQNRREVLALPQDTLLADKIRSMRRALINLEFEQYLDDAHGIYQILIKPIEKFLSDNRRLFIIPDGILYYLPFEALIREKPDVGDGPDFTRLTYLIKEFEISYHFSDALLMETLSRGKKQTDRAFLGIAPVFGEANESIGKEQIYHDIFQWENILKVFRSGDLKQSKFPELAHSTVEVTEIKSLFSERKLSSEVLLSADAREEKIKTPDTREYQYLHFATHGMINERQPGNSGVVLAPEDSGSVQDGILFANEIYDLELQADLVVLSACESGLGEIVKGEGLLGLTRGFIYSGAGNVIVSLWQVADQSTAQFMIQLYENILAGQSYGQALRNTKLAFIENASYAYPLDWSPFILVGY
jgi:CHAT domain-containing protein/Tfp pilus assembly protein PilF